MPAQTNVTVSDSSGTSVHEINFRGFTGFIFWIVIISILVFLVAFATEGWAEAGNTKVGLWRVCTCTEGNIQKESWFKASQAMFSIAFVSMVVTLVLAGLYMIFHSLNKNTLILLMIGACFITVLFLLIGLLIFGIEMDKLRAYNLSWSFAFACIACILCFAAGGMSVYQKIRAKQ